METGEEYREMITCLREALVAQWRNEERGDVPGWVMVTLMTAGLVVALGAVALPALTKLFDEAIAAVAVF